MSSKNKFQGLVIIGALVIMSGCLFGGGGGSGGKSSHRKNQESKCIKDSGCLLACGSEAHFNEVSKKVTAYLNTLIVPPPSPVTSATPLSTTGPTPDPSPVVVLPSGTPSTAPSPTHGTLAQALANLSPQDSKCYTCGVGCAQAAAPPGPTSPTTCKAGYGNVAAAANVDATGAATDYCRDRLGASLDPSTMKSQPGKDSGSMIYTFPCVCN